MALKKETKKKRKVAKSHPMHRIPKIKNCILLMLNAKIQVNLKESELKWKSRSYNIHYRENKVRKIF